MNLRATGITELFVLLTAMVAGAVFVFLAFELGSATRPSEMRVWGVVESTSGSGPSSSGSSSTTSTSSSSTATTAPASTATTAPASSTAPGSPTASSSISSPTSASSAPSSGGSAATGKVVFDKNCNGCHPGAKKGFGPEISGAAFKDKYPAEKDIVAVIRSGKGTMPGFKSDTITDDDAAGIAAYLRSLP